MSCRAYWKPGLREKTARMFNIHLGENAYDEVDRLPKNLRVTWFDIGCYSFSMCSYIFDMMLDIIVVIVHSQQEKTVAAVLTAAFIIVPSLILNLLSAAWWLDDYFNRMAGSDQTGDASVESVKHGSMSNQTHEIDVTDIDSTARHHSAHIYLWVIATLGQFGPLVWYLKGIRAARKCMNLQKRPYSAEVRYHDLYCEMIEAERDASVLRFLEAFLESMPQLLIQGYFLALDLQTGTFGGRVFSMCSSLLSISYSFAAHHRILRISLSQKENLQPTECYFILFWRLFTLTARFTCLIMVLMVSLRTAFIFFMLHFMISAVHIFFCQRVNTGSNFEITNKGLAIINIWIHTFAPFNMSEGRTRVRYGIGYGLELLEAIFVVALVNYWHVPFLPFQNIMCFAVGMGYGIGLTVMVCYHLYYHPTKRRT